MVPFRTSQLRNLCFKGAISITDYLFYKQLRRLTKERASARPFNLNNFNEEQCTIFFRFNRLELVRIYRAFGIPQICKTSFGDKFSGIEGLCICLRRLSYPNRLADLVTMFGRRMAAISRIFNWVINLIYHRFEQLLRSLDNTWLTQADLQKFAEKISLAGSPYPNIVGFIDGTARPICRPKRNQKDQYSGYKKQHVLKYQSVLFPNGLIGKLDGPFNGRRHDSAILRLSGLLNKLRTKFINADGTWYSLYGDPGYSNQKFIKVGYKKHRVLNEHQKRFNAEMSALRVHVEYGFGKILQNFAFVDFKKNQKLLLQPLKKYYIVCALLTNCHTCLKGSQVSDYFNCSPPSLEEYLASN